MTRTLPARRSSTQVAMAFLRDNLSECRMASFLDSRRALVRHGTRMALCATLSGCSLFGIHGSRIAWRDVTLIATQDANNNSPVAVDIVMVGDAGTLDKLLPLRAAQWFDERDDLVSTYPGVVRYQSWEVVPGDILHIDKRAFAGPRVAGVLVFARYAGPGAHRQRIDTYKGRLVLTMKTTGYTLEIQP